MWVFGNTVPTVFFPFTDQKVIGETVMDGLLGYSLPLVKGPGQIINKEKDLAQVLVYEAKVLN